jgi:beta-fructofuranosidase
MLDRHGRRILWGWITESRPDTELINAGWAGAMSLPRMMSLSADNQLQTGVAPEASILRAEQIAGGHAAKRSTLDELRIRDLAAELDIRLQPSGDFALRFYSDSVEFAGVSCSSNAGVRTLRINNLTCPLPQKNNSEDRLHIFLDGSVVEIFVNELTSMTARVYEIPSGPLRLKLEGDAKVESLEAWHIKPISNNRLTCP